MYHFSVKSIGIEDLEPEGFALQNVENALSEYFCDLFLELCGDVPAHDNVKGNFYSLNDIDEVYGLIESRYANLRIFDN